MGMRGQVVTMMATTTAAVTSQALRKTAFSIAKSLLLVDEDEIEEKVSRSDQCGAEIQCLSSFNFFEWFSMRISTVGGHKKAGGNTSSLAWVIVSRENVYCL
jgi:hypothetical protein